MDRPASFRHFRLNQVHPFAISTESFVPRGNQPPRPRVCIHDGQRARSLAESANRAERSLMTKEHSWATDALRSEANDLLFLADRIDASAVNPIPGLSPWRQQIEEVLTSPTFGSLGSERALDRLSRDLRTLWLSYAQGTADRYLRSPTADQQPAVTGTGTVMNFGYERELEPSTLEARCTDMYPAPSGWHGSHLLFSSGQATLTAVLHFCSGQTMAARQRPMRLLHLGGYFETAELLDVFAGGHIEAKRPEHSKLTSAFKCIGSMDTLLVELVYCDGLLRTLDFNAFAQSWRASREKPSMVIFDSTLVSMRFPLEDLLALFSGPDAPIVFRINSGLKLDQGGLELANVGTCSLYVHEDSRRSLLELTDELRRIRKLTGAGLGLQEIAALEAPWFLDPLYTRRYADSVFANNRCLARLFKPKGRLFSELSHPAVEDKQFHWTEAPFCVLTLRNSSPSAYHCLAEIISAEAARRNLAFESGGSFGFRGHRFDAILPESEDGQPFLRIAVGARGGPSIGGIAKLLNDIGAANEVAELPAKQTTQHDTVNPPILDTHN